MDALVSTLTSSPIPTLLVIAVVVLAASRARRQPAGQSARSVVVALACYALALGVVTWAEDDAVRLELLLTIVIVVAALALVRIVQKTRARPGRSATESATEPDRTEIR